MPKSLHQQRVEAFMVGARQYVPRTPQSYMHQERRRLRAKLILEEAKEAVAELGFDENLQPIPVFDEPLPRLIKELCDLSVVTIGTLSAFGVQDEDVLRIVDENNMLKLVGVPTFDEHGKLLKPKNHPSPLNQIQEYLDAN